MVNPVTSEAKNPEPEANSGDRIPARKLYTGVVYFHGIGSQRRYEEVSQLVDQLDLHQFNEHGRGNSKGMLSNIKARVEPLRTAEKGGVVGYVRSFFNGRSANAPSKTVRFYEVYWAPIMADIASPWGVLRWAFSQVGRPLKTARSPWRERQRLRRSVLHSLFRSGSAAIDGVEERDCGNLLKLYDQFEGLPAHRQFPKGTFEDFERFIEQQNQNKPIKQERLLALARVWRSAYRRDEAHNMFVLLTIALALILFGAGVLLLATALLKPLIATGWLVPILGDLKADIPTVATGLVSLLGFLGLGKLLADYLGDVEAWATFKETDSKNVARNKVLNHSMEILAHVLSDESCERVIIVSHSLGTSIANDTMLGLARLNRATDVQKTMDATIPLDKIDQFVTLGSPIDKIEYFFESFTSESHRYKRVKDAMRGDINTAPFSASRVPHIHWVNFWDEGDPISGPLQSPSGNRRYLHRVDDVHVATYGFPAPGASHSGYFENRTVISALYDIIFLGKHSYWPLRTNSDRTPADYHAEDLGPGTGHGQRRFYLKLALALPWFALGGAVSWLTGYTLPFWIFVALGGGSVAIMAIKTRISKRVGSLDPI